MTDHDELEATHDMLIELEQLTTLGWLDGEGKDERLAIIFWKQGDLLFRQKKHQFALNFFLESENRIPNHCVSLKEKLAISLSEVGSATQTDGLEKAKAIKSEITLIAFEHSLMLNPNQPYVRHDYALQHDLAGNKNEALKSYLEHHKLADPSVTSRINIGNVYFDLNRYEDAISAYTEALKLEPKSADAWNSLGNLHYSLGNHGDSISAYNRAIKLEPKSADAWNALGNVHDSLEHYDDAISAFNRAIKLDPQSPSAAMAHNNLAGIYLHQGKLDDAVKELEKRIHLKTDNTFAPLITLGVIAYHMGSLEYKEHFQNALSQWDKALIDELQSPAGLLGNKSTALLCLGNKAEAIRILQESISQMTPGDQIEFDDYKLLLNAPVPPDGIKDVISILEKAQKKRKK